MFQTTSRQAEEHATSRRLHRRYPISANLDYRLLNNTPGLQSGRGRTANLSSGGVLFQSEHVFKPGVLLALAVTWPAKINDSVGLTLHIVGRVVRVEGKWAAVATSRYEFRTRSLRSPAYQSGAEDRQRAGGTIATMPSPRLLRASSESAG